MKKFILAVLFLALPTVVLAAPPMTIEAPAGMTDEEISVANDLAMHSSSPVILVRAKDTWEFPAPLVLKENLISTEWTVYEDRFVFENALDSFLLDDFSSYDEGEEGFVIFTDDEMSAASVTGTSFVSTAFPDINIVNDEHGTGEYYYCAGCNGSFLLIPPPDTNAIGFDVVWAWGGEEDGKWWATIMFAGNTVNVTLPHVLFDSPKFFGFSSSDPIVAVHIGGHNGSAWNSGEMVIDNLTVGVEDYPIFTDGFESGDTSLWSAVVGE